VGWKSVANKKGEGERCEKIWKTVAREMKMGGKTVWRGGDIDEKGEDQGEAV